MKCFFLSFQEEEQRNSDSSESQEENPDVEKKEEENDSAKSGKTQNGPEAARCEEKLTDDKEENLLKIEKKEEVGQKVSGDFHISGSDLRLLTKLCDIVN